MQNLLNNGALVRATWLQDNLITIKIYNIKADR